MRLFLILCFAAVVTVPAAVGMRTALVGSANMLFSPAVLTAGAR